MLLIDLGLDAVITCLFSDSTEGLLETEGERESLLENWEAETLIVCKVEPGGGTPTLFGVVDMRIEKSRAPSNSIVMDLLLDVLTVQ